MPTKIVTRSEKLYKPMTPQTVTAAQAKARAVTSSNAATKSSRNSRQASRARSGAATAGTKRERRPKPLKRSQVTNIAMTTGGEKRISKIILDGVVKEWVGIGWIDLEPATPEDYLKIPEVK